MGKRHSKKRKAPSGKNKDCKAKNNNSDKIGRLKNDEIKKSMNALDSDFVKLKEKVRKLMPIMQRYRFEDLICAVYCISVNVKNRSLLESMMALNQVLLDFEVQGDLAINNYTKFTVFFNEIQTILSSTSYDDYTIEDFGEVKQIFDGKHYSVLIGTGYEQSYGYYQLIPTIVKTNNSESIYKKLLEYSEDRINFFKDINRSDETYEIEINLPNEELFKKTQSYLELFEKTSRWDEIFEYFDGEASVSGVHFVERENKRYPLYNTALLLDFLSKELSNKSKNQTADIIDVSISDLLTSLSKLQDPLDPRIMCPVIRVNEKKRLSKILYTFLLLSKDGAVIAINSGRYSSVEIDEEIKELRKDLSHGALMFAEAPSLTQRKNSIGIQVNHEAKIKILLYENIADPTECVFVLKEKSEKYLNCLAVDIIYFLSFMDDIDQISRFFEYIEKTNCCALSFGGVSDYFLSWKESNEIIEKGAVSYDTLTLMPGSSDDYVFKFFKNNLQNYPRQDKGNLFDNFHTWNVKPREDGFIEYGNKINKDFVGIGKTYKNNCFVFYVHNIEFYKKKSYSEKIVGLIALIDDLNFRNARLYNSWFETNTIFNNKIIQLMYMPIEYAISVDKNGFTADADRKYVYSDLKVMKNNIIIRYTIKEKELYANLEAAKDRTVEATYYLELLKPLARIAGAEYKDLIEKIMLGMHLPKGVGVASIPLDYKWSDKSRGYHVSDLAFHLVRKEIAILCKKIGIREGEYSGKQTNQIIRSIQAELISYFEKCISKYDRLLIHSEALSIYSKTVHNINLHKIRYENFEDIDELEYSKFQEQTIQLRENEKHHLRVVEFFLETNLLLESNRGNKKLTGKDLEFVLAFSNWIVVLFDAADICFKSELDKHIKIRNDFVIEIVENEEMLNIHSGVNKRIYDNDDYTIKDDEQDKVCLEAAMNAFKMDIGIDFIKLINLLDFLTLLSNEHFAKEIHPDTYSLNKDEMIKAFMDTYEGEISRHEVTIIVNFLTLNPKLLKKWKGKFIDFLPINEREYRPDRFNLKPIVSINNMLVFSPVVMSDLEKRWCFGMIDFYLPLEDGLTNTVESILKWKKRYEDMIVDDAYKIFKDFGLSNVWKEVEFHKIDKGGNHPIDLGDYDLIALDSGRNTLWVIECKVLNKVGTIHESIMQQHNFFLYKKYDEKFQKRIDYIKVHWRSFLEAQNIENPQDLQIKPLMITNKVFISRYKKVKFEIATLYEFRNQLKSLSNNM